uniref:Ribosomal protein S4 n=1 Tax=Cyanidium caldarium TaxID=2771 RepID=A0A7H0WBB9_CYACA|nr:ribosomal protein S4 [Cyanidium caldarium]QNR39848.1 ribosomal protein S4 [Cyanidium caldarium]
MNKKHIKKTIKKINNYKTSYLTYEELPKYLNFQTSDKILSLSKRIEIKKSKLYYGNIKKNRLLNSQKKVNYNTLENSLDIVLIKSFIHLSIFKVRQWINHKLIKINSKTNQYPTFQLNKNDIITLDFNLINSMKQHIHTLNKLSNKKNVFEISLINSNIEINIKAISIKIIKY